MSVNDGEAIAQLIVFFLAGMGLVSIVGGVAWRCREWWRARRETPQPPAVSEMTREEIEAHLNAIRGWAHDKIEGGQEPPWAYEHYVGLRAVMDATLAGLAATITLEESINQDPQAENVVLMHPPKFIPPL